MGVNRKNTVDFSDIFAFAEKEFQIGWNQASTLFFHTILDYKSTNEFYCNRDGRIEGIEDHDDGSPGKVALEIMQAFMIKNKLKSLLVLNN